MSTAEATIAVTAYYTALRAGDVESWLALFTHGAVVENPAGARPATGVTALRELWEELTCPFQVFDVNQDFAVVTACGAAVKWTVRAVTMTGQPAAAEGIDVLEIDASGRITGLSSYWEPARLRAQLCGPTGGGDRDERDRDRKPRDGR
jgi:ketosteroid isomerase-like protein